ncbi:MAG: hypothetical protein KC416_09735 [Myxococcales bacterium]|nr:hypothetical protein [Myxococcales bacterium]
MTDTVNPAPIPITAGIHHIALRTGDLERLGAFYGTLLSRTPVRRTERALWYALGSAVLMLERAGPSEPSPDRQSMELLAFDVRPQNLGDAEAHLGALDIEIESRTDHTLYFRDPDGRRLALSTHPLT